VISILVKTIKALRVRFANYFGNHARLCAWILMSSPLTAAKPQNPQNNPPPPHYSVETVSA
jgi:hypothetical protein